MKKRYSMIIITLLAIVVIGIFINNNSLMQSTTSRIKEESGYYISKYGKVSIEEWEKVDLTEGRFEDVEDFLQEVDYYVEAISKYIDKEDWIAPYKEMHGDDFKFIINFKFSHGGSHVFGAY